MIHRTSIATDETRDFEKRLGARIRQIRKRRKISNSAYRESLARRGVTISEPTLVSWENGGRCPPVGVLPVIAAALGCDLSTLLPKGETE